MKNIVDCLFFGAYSLALKSVGHIDDVSKKDQRFFSVYAVTFMSLFTSCYFLLIEVLLEKIGLTTLISFRTNHPIICSSIVLVSPTIILFRYFIWNKRYLSVICQYNQVVSLNKKATWFWIGYMLSLIIIGMPILYICSN